MDDGLLDVHHAQLSWPPGGGIMLGSAREEDGDDDPWPLRPGNFAVRGPEGNHWSFGTYRGEPRRI